MPLDEEEEDDEELEVVPVPPVPLDEELVCAPPPPPGPDVELVLVLAAPPVLPPDPPQAARCPAIKMLEQKSVSRVDVLSIRAGLRRRRLAFIRPATLCQSEARPTSAAP